MTAAARTAAAQVAALAALLLSGTPLLAQADPLDGFDAWLAGAVDSWGATGLAVAVVKDDSLLFAEGYGTLRLGGGERVDAETLFAIGSTTKAMTAATVGMLVDEGLVHWDDPVVDHLPWFRLADPYLTRAVTVRDLLTHRAGLGNADLLWYGRPDRSTEEIVRALAHLEPAYRLRDGYVYQNVMYAAAGQLVTEVSGTPWETFVADRIFRPLGMTRTVATLADTRGVANVASPHDVVDGELRVVENAAVDPVAAAGSVWSSVEDMSRWLRFLLRGCRTPDGDALLEPGTCDELFSPQHVLAEPQYPTARLTEPHWTTYGLGWFQQDYDGRKVDFHTGSIDGMVAIAGLVLDEGLGVYVLGNRDHVEVRHAILWDVIDRFDPHRREQSVAGHPPRRDWSAELLALYDDLRARGDSAAAAARAARVEGTSPSLPLERYAGTYRNEVYGEVAVTLDAAGDLRLAYGPSAATLRHWHFDTFQADWDLAQRGDMGVTFALDASGAPDRLEIGGVPFVRVRERP